MGVVVTSPNPTGLPRWFFNPHSCAPRKIQLASKPIELTTTPLSSVQHINELESKAEALQIFSNGNSFFWRHLAKTPSYL
jgi:hypothetical protein